jgi:Mg2+ and Co2+ transporter CorA
MKIFDFKTGKDYIINTKSDVKTTSKMLNNKHLCLAEKEDIPLLKKYYKIDNSSLKETDIIDETVRYTKYKEYHFISLIFIDEDIKKHEINIFFCDSWLIIEYNNFESRLAKNFHTFVQNKINSIFEDEKNADIAMAKILYYLFDAYIFESSKLLEKYEDLLEKLQDDILKNASKKMLDKINEYRNDLYIIKKHYRSLKNINFLNDTYNPEIPEKIFSTFTSVSKRVHNLFTHSDELYSLCNQLSSLYDTKLNANTNITITRLTVITVIMGI